MLVRVLYTRLDANPEEFTYSRGGINAVHHNLRSRLNQADSHVPTWWHLRDTNGEFNILFARTYVVASAKSNSFSSDSTLLLADLYKV